MERTADLAIRWHLIGHLQSNKAQKAAPAFAGDPLDRFGRSAAADRRGGGRARAPRRMLFIQVDLAGEATKYGAAEADVPASRSGGRDCRAARLVGLMLLPPWSDDPEQARPYFRALRELRERLVDGGVDAPMLRELSMGMSHDFEVAIEEGATLVRVGTAIFGNGL